MVFAMLSDVLIFAVILVGMLVAAAAFLVVLYAPAHDVPIDGGWWHGGWSPSGLECTDSFATFGGAMRLLLEASLSGDHDLFACAEDSTNPRTLWWVSVTFYFIVSLMLLNMLIAMSKGAARTAC